MRRPMAIVSVGFSAIMLVSGCSGQIGSNRSESSVRGDADASDDDASTPDGGEVSDGGTDNMPVDAGNPVDGGMANDTGVDAGGAPDTGVPPANTVPMFVATGHGGRRATSCDGGQTWLTACQLDGQNQAGCSVEVAYEDHHPWAGQNVIYANGYFFALFGWFGGGTTAQILRSDDGRAWNNVFGANTMGKFGTRISAGGRVLVVNAERSSIHRSVSSGDAWSTQSYGAFDAPILRTMIFIPGGTHGRFISFGDGARVAYSDDGALIWTETTHDCPHDIRHLALGNGVLIAKSDSGICRSVNGGLAWTSVYGFTGAGNVIWTGSEFFISQAYTGTAFRSTDGVTWSTDAISGTFNGSSWPMIVESDGQGTLVGVMGSQFFRSTDNGTTWSGPTTFSGNPIVDVVFGYGRPSADCPAP